MKTTQIIKLGFVFFTLSSMLTCHPYQWSDLPRVDPACPTVLSIRPSGGPFGTEITVVGKNFAPENLAQFNLTVNEVNVPILDIVDDSTLVFKIPKSLNSGLVNVTREGCSGGSNSTAEFTYYYTVTTPPFVYAGTKDDYECENCLNGPRGLDMDAGGTLYVADFENQVIQEISTTRQMKIIAGQKGISGNEDNPFNGLGATFANPSDVALDASGNIYVADQGNNSIRKIEIGLSRPVKTISSATTGIIANYSQPTGIATDGGERIFVVEYIGQKYQILDLAIENVTPVDPVSSCQLSFPTGIEFNPDALTLGGSILVADFNNKLVRAFNQAGSCMNVPELPVSPFSLPFDMALGDQDNVFVTDQGLKKVLVVYPDNTVQEINGFNFTSPSGITFDEKNQALYVADNMLHVIVKFGLE